MTTLISEGRHLLPFGASGDMGLLEKFSNSNGMKAVGKLKLHHKQTKCH